MIVVDVERIRAALDIPTAIERIEEGFAAYSAGKLTVPPVGHLDFENPPGECHIKYGYVHGDDHFVIKVATGFYENAKQGLPNSSGLMILFSAETGEAEVLLQDAGYLTDVRTAIAGCLSARYLAPSAVERIGIVGGGIQARMQLEYLQHATDCRDVAVWTRRPEQAADYRVAMAGSGFDVRVAESPRALCESCNLIVTTTAATEPLLMSDWIRAGTHVTAMGSDGPGKQELDPSLFARAGRCVVDSLSQCTAFGESRHAVANGFVTADDLVELGAIVAGAQPGRRADDEITIADLTGVAVQDIQIAKAVWSEIAD